MSSDSAAPISSGIVLPYPPSSTFLIYRTYLGGDITDALLEQCAQLFGNNYGVWGSNPTTTKGPKAGSRVKMSARRLREQCVAVPNSTILVVCYGSKKTGQGLDDVELVGHAFASVWDFNGGRVGWITQLVVSLAKRKRYIATSLLQMLKKSTLFHGITAIGLVSSHPSACHVLFKYAGVLIHSPDLTFCQRKAKLILEASPVRYVKNMELHGSLFEDTCTTGAVSSVFTDFYVDHAEPLEALAVYKSTGAWALGELLEGHEFLIILPVLTQGL